MTGFLPRPPLGKAIALAEADLKGHGRPEDLAWLTEHPATWMQALDLLRVEVENHTATLRAALNRLKPTAPPASTAYLEAKREFELKNGRRLYYLGTIRHRRAEVASLVGYDAYTLVSDAKIVDVLTRVENLLEAGETPSAESLLHTLLDGIEQHLRPPALRDAG